MKAQEINISIGEKVLLVKGKKEVEAKVVAKYRFFILFQLKNYKTTFLYDDIAKIVIQDNLKIISIK